MWLLCCKIPTFLHKIFEQNQQIKNLLLLFLNWFFILLKITKLDSQKTDVNVINTDWEKQLFSCNTSIHLLDILCVYFYSTYLNFKKKTKNTTQIAAKVQQLNNNSFFLFNNQENLLSSTQLFLYGIRSMWKHLRFWILPLCISLLFIYYSFFLRSLPFSKIFFGYILLANMFYLFISGFVFFIKKYQYRLYTSAIQRFWRRSLMVFWLLEGFLISVFVYLILNANQEPVYVYDNIQVFKTHLFSWRYFLVKIILSSLLVILTYMFLLSIKWNTFTKTNNIALFITVILLYVAWLEFYQLFHLLNCYGTSNWVYDFSEHLWNLELEFKRTRIVNHYVTIGLIAKFWHVVFAVVFWVFFLLRGFESTRFRYPLLAANLQNFLLIYFLGWLYMYPWLKFCARKTLDMPYFWFFVNNRKLGVFVFFNDIKLYFWGLLDMVTFYDRFSVYFKNTPFYYWFESSSNVGNTQFRKHNIRDLFIRSIY